MVDGSQPRYFGGGLIARSSKVGRHLTCTMIRLKSRTARDRPGTNTCPWTRRKRYFSVYNFRPQRLIIGPHPLPRRIGAYPWASTHTHHFICTLITSLCILYCTGCVCVCVSISGKSVFFPERPYPVNKQKRGSPVGGNRQTCRSTAVASTLVRFPGGVYF